MDRTPRAIGHGTDEAGVRFSLRLTGVAAAAEIFSRCASDDVLLSVPLRSESVGGELGGTALVPPTVDLRPLRSPPVAIICSLSNSPGPASASTLSACAEPMPSSPRRWRFNKLAHR